MIPPKSYLENVMVFFNNLASGDLFYRRGSFWVMFLMLEKSKVAYLGITIFILSEDSPSAWKLLVASVDAILDSLFR